MRTEELSSLTPRQRQIIGLVGGGLSNQQIGEALGIRIQTVKNQLVSVYERLGGGPPTGRRGAQTRWLFATDVCAGLRGVTDPPCI